MAGFRLTILSSKKDNEENEEVEEVEEEEEDEEDEEGEGEEEADVEWKGVDAEELLQVEHTTVIKL